MQTVPRDPTKRMVSLRLSSSAREQLSEAAVLAGAELGTVITQTQAMEIALREFCERHRGNFVKNRERTE